MTRPHSSTAGPGDRDRRRPGTNVADVSLVLITNPNNPYRKAAFIFGGEATVKVDFARRPEAGPWRAEHAPGPPGGGKAGAAGPRPTAAWIARRSRRASSRPGSPNPRSRSARWAAWVMRATWADQPHAAGRRRRAQPCRRGKGRHAMPMSTVSPSRPEARERAARPVGRLRHRPGHALDGQDGGPRRTIRTAARSSWPRPASSAPG